MVVRVGIVVGGGVAVEVGGGGEGLVMEGEVGGGG